MNIYVWKCYVSARAMLAIEQLQNQEKEICKKITTMFSEHTKQAAAAAFFQVNAKQATCFFKCCQKCFSWNMQTCHALFFDNTCWQFLEVKHDLTDLQKQHMIK